MGKLVSESLAGGSEGNPVGISLTGHLKEVSLKNVKIICRGMFTQELI